MQQRPATWINGISLGWVLALLVLLLAIIFAAIGQLDLKPAVLFALLALSRLVP